jgi:hypothetical protein
MSIKLKVPAHASEALEELQSQGLVITREVDLDTPKLPEDITELDDEDLMRLFTKLIAYIDFLSTQAALAQIDERESERCLNQVEAEVTANLPVAKGDKVSVIKAQAAADPSVVEAAELYSSAYSYRKIIESMLDNYERDAMLVSRELTRRTAGDTYKSRSRKFVS